jgi:hypothetical protein
MTTLDLSKKSTRKPGELVRDIELSEDALVLLPGAVNTCSYIQALCDQELFGDAFLTLARTLPRQYAIAWAAKCVEESLAGELDERDRQCLDLARRWLGGPNEEIRRAALDAADDSDYQGQYAWLAASVGFSGGSLAPVNQVEVPPPSHLTAVAVSACLLYVANQDEEVLVENANQIIERGLAMAAIPGS